MAIRYMNHYDFYEYLNESKKFIRDESTVESDLERCEHIIFYETPNGKVPVRDFLMSITDKKLYNATIKSILDLEDLRRNAKFPLVKPLKNGILELRTDVNKNLTRIFYFFIYGDQIVFTNGYIKKTEKTDPDEIKKACDYRDDFMQRQIMGRKK